MITRGIFAMALAVLLAVSSEAASVQARLIRASNGNAVSSDAALKDIEGKLKEKFGYKNHRQLSGKQQTIKSNDPLLFNLGEGFSLVVVPKSVDAKQCEMQIEWHSSDTLLVRSTIKALHNGHVFINGPKVGDGQIFLAVSVRN